MEYLTHSINFLFFLLTSLLISSGANSSSNNSQFFECLAIKFQTLNSTISDVIYTPNNSSYSSLLQSLNERAASISKLRPVAIITPWVESEIQAAVQCSKKYGFQLRVRSGGHDFEGLSYISEIPFFIVDMRNMRSISIDDEEKTALIQVGATLGELYYTIAAKDRTLAFTIGVCPTVGVGGHLSGGGYDMMSRRHGIVVDHIIDAKLINADGEILDRKSMGEDLFWAIRGGGGTSFGIVVSFKVNLIVVPQTVTVFNVSRTLEQNATQLVLKWKQIAENIDENILLRLFLRSIRSPVDGERTIQASFTSLYLGGVEDLLPIMQENFSELGLVKQDCTEMSWIESTLYFAGFQNQSLYVLLDRSQLGGGEIYFKGKSDFVQLSIPENGLNGIWEFLNKEDIKQTELQLSPYGGRLNDVSESETPFPHRSGIIFMIHYLVICFEDGNSALDKHVGWIQRLYRYMAPYVSKHPRHAYFNYRDLDIGKNNIQGNTSYAQASAWGSKYFKNNFKRLVQVKTQVDPSNFFRNEQSVPPLPTLDSENIYLSLQEKMFIVTIIIVIIFNINLVTLKL
ncbi:tetrahydroberberine oxidase-like [Henckelia pumila]|uniref:tetrahydroberberine oxidase-like n=1 Tax=Henckelia pumila TaxID=405737 RepID=UPI003C6E6FE8